MIANISDRKDTSFLLIDKALSNKNKSTLLKNGVFRNFVIPSQTRIGTSTIRLSLWHRKKDKLVKSYCTNLISANGQIKC